MSLDLLKVVSQVESMVARLKAGVKERQDKLQQALQVIELQAADLDAPRSLTLLPLTAPTLMLTGTRPQGAT